MQKGYNVTVIKYRYNAKVVLWLYRCDSKEVFAEINVDSALDLSIITKSIALY